MDSMLLVHNEQVEDDVKVLEKNSHSNFRIYQTKLGEKSLSKHKIIHKQDQRNYVILFDPKKHFFCLYIFSDGLWTVSYFKMRRHQTKVTDYKGGDSTQNV